MKTVWLFGGSKKPFGKVLTNGIDNVISFGRDNIDYSDIDGFLKNINTYPNPDLIIFNISNHGHYINFEKKFTPRKDIDILIEMINTTFYFELRLVEWFFQNFDNKKILWLTSMQPYSFDYNKDDGDLLLYRMTRTLEHQVIFQQNILKHNIEKNNFIMGACVGNNAPGISNYLNKLILENRLQSGIFGLHDNSPTTNQVSTITLSNKIIS